jgi:transposase-like protein
VKEIKEKTNKMKLIELERGVKLEEVLRQLYVDEHKSIENIAKNLNISYVTVIKWLKLAGIYSRKLDI